MPQLHEPKYQKLQESEDTRSDLAESSPVSHDTLTPGFTEDHEENKGNTYTSLQQINQT